MNNQVCNITDFIIYLITFIIA